MTYTITEEDKKRILWVRSLLKQNAPIIYERFKGYKLNKLHERLETNEQTNISK